MSWLGTTWHHEPDNDCSRAIAPEWLCTGSAAGDIFRFPELNGRTNSRRRRDDCLRRMPHADCELGGAAALRAADSAGEITTNPAGDRAGGSVRLIYLPPA